MIRWGPILCLASLAGAGVAQESEPSIGGASQVLPRGRVVWGALRYNPELAVPRQQHGIAAAAVVIADTYPFNPAWSNKLFAVTGPEGITNRVAMEQRISIDVELHGQRKHRR